MRGATPHHGGSRCNKRISIHAPRAGRDRLFPFRCGLPPGHFNPRAPCGARRTHIAALQQEIEFQSTRPVRGATIFDQLSPQAQNISIHAPRAGRDAGHQDPGLRDGISIHAPRAGRDPHSCRHTFATLIFQSTRPVRGATGVLGLAHPRGAGISIHAPRAGRDRRSSMISRRRTNFNPRAPCGARLEHPESQRQFQPFQSTRPVRGATRQVFRQVQLLRISIHAPRAGRDRASPQPHHR